jgi:hypothetical protein
MCCGGGGDAPNPPDPFATAQAQQNAFINSAIANAYLNRIDEVTPFGSVHYQEINPDGSPIGSGSGGQNFNFSGGAIGSNPSWAGPGWDALAGALGKGGTGGGGRPARQPNGWGGVPRMERIISLNPEEQKILDQRRGIQQSLLDQIAGQTPFTFNGAPGAGLGLLEEAKDLARQPGPDLTAYRELANRPGPSLAAYNELANRPGPSLARYKELANRPGPKLDEAARQQVQDALYRRQTAELDPRYKQQQTDLETQLANQGVMRGSEAWTKSFEDFNRVKDRAYGDARDRAITGGGEEMQRLFNMKLARRGQNLGALQNLYGMQSDRRGQNLGALQNLFGMQTTRRGQNLGALQNLYGMQSDRRADRLAAYGNLFGLSQQARNNWMKEQLTKRGLPLQELNALLGGNGVNVPQFKSPSDINVEAPDIDSLIQNNYNNQLGLWRQQQQNQNDTMRNIASIAGTLGSAAAAGIW